MMQKISRTFGLMKDAGGVLRQDKELLAFPLLSGLFSLVVLASFAIPLLEMASLDEAAGSGEGQPIGLYLAVFGFYLVSYFVITFFNTGIIACAIIRMDGGDPTVRDGLRAAWERLPVIIGWSLLAGTVGFVLQLIEQRSEAVGRIVAGILGLAWTVTSFLAVPILVMENRGPIDALKHSTRLLKDTWGEQIMGTFGFGAVFFLLGLPAVGLLALGFFSGSAAGMVIFIALAVIYWIVLALVQSALHSIYQAAVYRYARFGDEPKGFKSENLSGAFATK